jgi:hypothetical protein
VKSLAPGRELLVAVALAHRRAHYAPGPTHSEPPRIRATRKLACGHRGHYIRPRYKSALRTGKTDVQANRRASGQEGARH